MSDTFPPAQPHEPPREILPDVLFVHGTMRMGPGMTINRNMVALRHEGELTLLNPVRLSAEGEAALEAFGTVQHAVRLGCMHSLDDPYTVKRFGARFWCAPGADAGLEPKPDALLEASAELPIPGAELFTFRGVQKPECAVLFRRADLLVTCDAVQHWESTSGCSLLGKLACHAMGFLHPANIGPPWRRIQTPKGGSLESEFERLSSLGFENWSAHTASRSWAARAGRWRRR